MRPSHAWIFQATPRTLDLARELHAGEDLLWSVARYGRKLRPGDRVYYWQAGRDAGIYGLGRVQEVLLRDQDGRYPVRTSHERALFAPVTRAELRADPDLGDLTVLRQPRGTVFPLTPTQDLLLAQRIGNGYLELAVPAARYAGGKVRLSKASDDDLPVRVRVAYERGDAVVVLLIADGVVRESGRVIAARPRRGDLELRLAPLPGYVPPALPHDIVAALAEGNAVQLITTHDAPPGIAPRYEPLGAVPLDAGPPGTAPPLPSPPPPLPVVPRVAEYPNAYEPTFDFAPAPEEISGDLIVPPEVVAQLVAAVNAGRHIVLMGLPGTGKTSLALNLARAAMTAGLCAGPVLATATADWSTFDTVGGLVPGQDGALRFAEGVALRALRENRWLVLDELNRADIDKAFGPLLTVLSGGPVDLPTVTIGGRAVRIEATPGAAGVSADGATYYAGTNWRIVATMNTLDRAALFSFSLAFARRFAFILVPPPDPAALLALVQRRVALDESAVTMLRRLMQVTPRPLGPAIILDAAGYIAARSDAAGLAEAVGAFVLPQFEGVDAAAVADFARDLAPALGPGGAAALLAYVRALYGEG